MTSLPMQCVCCAEGCKQGSPQFQLRCLAASGHVCKQCTQVLSRRARNRYRQNGSLPNCKAHGVFALKGHAAVVDALLECGYTGLIKLEASHHSHGSCSHIKGKLSRRCAYRADLQVTLDDDRELVVEVDGPDHACAHMQARDGKKGCRIGLPIFRVDSQQAINIPALTQFLWGPGDAPGTG